MERKQHKCLDMGGIYRFNESDKEIIVVTNENDENYSSLMPVGAVVINKRPLNSFFSLPVIMDDDSVKFAHANYAVHYDMASIQNESTHIGNVSPTVLELVRLCLCRRFIDDPNYFRGLVEEVHRYKQEIAELTGNKLIKVNPEEYFAEEKKEKHPTASSESDLELSSCCAVLESTKRQPMNYWTTSNLILLLDIIEQYGPTQVGRELKFSNPCQLACNKRNKAKEILTNRGISPSKRHEILKEREEKEKRKLEEKDRASLNPPKRKTPSYLYAPLSWDKRELKLFCEDLDTYNLDTIQKMYGFPKPLNMKFVDRARSAALTRGVYSMQLGNTPPPKNNLGN